MVILGGHNRVAQRARIAQNNEEDCLESARMVLPFILRHNSLLRQQQLKNQEKREDKPCVELHLPRIFLTRTIGNIEATAMRSTRPAALKRKPDVVPVSLSEMKDFMCLIENDFIQSFLRFDACKVLADSYLLAMVFTYFIRASYRKSEYNVQNFFSALMLAHTVEEEGDDSFELLPWAGGPNWQSKTYEVFSKRDNLFKRIDYRALVSRKCCLQVMALVPDHWAWQRERPFHHGGVKHCYDCSSDDYRILVRGPNSSPRPCFECETKETVKPIGNLETVGKRRLSRSKRYGELDTLSHQQRAKLVKGENCSVVQSN